MNIRMRFSSLIKDSNFKYLSASLWLMFILLLQSVEAEGRTQLCKSRYIASHSFPLGFPDIHTGLAGKMDNRQEASTLLKQQENATQYVLWHFTCPSTLAFISLVLSTSSLSQKTFGDIITLDNIYLRVQQIPSMNFQNKETILKTISNNDGTLDSFQGLYK